MTVCQASGRNSTFMSGRVGRVAFITSKCEDQGCEKESTPSVNCKEIIKII